MALKGRRKKRNALVKPPLGDKIQALKKNLASMRAFAVPDHDYWAVLPKPHRIGISVLAVLIIVLVLWPNSDDESPLLTEEDQLDEFIPSHLKNSDMVGHTQAISDLSLLSGIVDEKDDDVVVVVVDPSGDDHLWVSHKVAPGDTLAEIFRSQKLPLPDLYAITAIEGKDKPLSHIQPGQRLRFKRNLQGEIEMIEVERTNKRAVLFSRLANGRFVRR